MVYARMMFMYLPESTGKAYVNVKRYPARYSCNRYRPADFTVSLLSPALNVVRISTLVLTAYPQH